MAILAPSILSSDFSNLAQQIRFAEMGGADWIHCDVMDGHFVPNLTFGTLIIKATRKSTKLPIDVHLMIENPDKYLEDLAEAGANHLFVHYETVIHLNRTITKIKELGMKAGVAINPSTSVSVLKYIMEYADALLIMSVNPGFGGQSFIPNSLDKISEAVKLREELKTNFLIQVDGGIDKENIKQILNAGCDVFIIGSSIFKSDNITAAATEFKNLIK
jgi:ribulose-phosphate 3-epimerase